MKRFPKTSSPSTSTLENELSRLDPGAPPPDLVARCLAALPEASEPAPARRPDWRRRRLFPMRLAAVAATLIAGAAWTTWPRSHSDGTTRAASAAFAQTLDAMGRVSLWHTRSRQITFEPGDGRTRLFRYNIASGWRESETWFDANRGMYSNEIPTDGETVQRTLLTPNGDWHFRHANHTFDKVRVTRMGRAYWEKTRDEQQTGLRDPRFWAGNFDQAATAPVWARDGEWNGRPTRVFLFDVAPSAASLQNDPPTKRTEIHVDPQTRRIVARRQFSRWPNHPDRGEIANWVETFDYDIAPAPSVFDPQAFRAGTSEVQTQDGGPGTVLDPQ